MKPAAGLALVSTLLIGSLSSSGAWGGTALDRIMAMHVMVLATDPVWPPFSWRNENGTFEGFDIDVAQEIARRMGVTLKYTTPDWVDQTAGHWNGKWDISVGSMTPTAERAKNLDFPAIYYWVPVSVAVHDDNTSAQTPSDLSGKRVGVLGNTTYELYLRRQPMEVVGMLPVRYQINDPVIVTYDQEDKVFDALSSGDEIDAMMNYLPVLMYEAKQGRPLRIIGLPVFYVSNAVAIDQGDAEFSALLGSVVDGMKKDGTLAAISVKWFQFDFSKSP